MNKVNCHNLKLLPEYFKAVKNGTKTFEIRFEDRDFKQGDFVVLHEWTNEGGATGAAIKKQIGFITDFEQKIGYVVFALIDLDAKDL